MEKFRCRWCEQHTELMDYHDNIWGKPKTSDDSLFEALTLEIFQAGLSWSIVYRKRAGFKQAFGDYDVTTIASFTENDVAMLMHNPNIVRHRKKIEATIYNAQQVCQLQQQYGSFLAFLAKLPTEQQIHLLCERFHQVGPTTAKSFLTACGYIQPIHEKRCYLY